MFGYVGLHEVSLYQVDTHVHVASAMNQKRLLRFIKNKMKYNSEDVVCLDNKHEEMSLEQVREAVYVHCLNL